MLSMLLSRVLIVPAGTQLGSLTEGLDPTTVPEWHLEANYFNDENKPGTITAAFNRQGSDWNCLSWKQKQDDTDSPYGYDPYRLTPWGLSDLGMSNTDY